VLLLLLLLDIGPLACGGGSAQIADAPPKLLHSPELNAIMKTEVNQPFSALMFLVFHEAEAAGADAAELDYTKLATPVETLRAGVGKVRAMPNPPVATAEGRAVFTTYVESLARDADQLAEALTARDRDRIAGLLKKVTHTCNDCHHFFRLKVVDEGAPKQAQLPAEPRRAPLEAAPPPGRGGAE
jgi:cytochrome c556